MTKKDELDKQEFIGSLKFTLHELVGKTRQTLTSEIVKNPKLKKVKKAGELSITAEEKKSDYGKTTVEFYLEVTMKKDAIKPYFIVFSKKNKTNHQMVPVLKTECKGAAMKKSKTIYYN